MTPWYAAPLAGAGGVPWRWRMLELVMWSFAMALTPLRAGLLWRLISGPGSTNQAHLPGSGEEHLGAGFSSGTFSSTQLSALMDTKTLHGSPDD